MKVLLIAMMFAALSGCGTYGQGSADPQANAGNHASWQIPSTGNGN